MPKRYYWLKLKDDFFDSKRIKKLRRMAGGDTYTIIYLKMQLLSVKTDGVLSYTMLEPSFAEELALDLDEDVDDVRMCLTYLQSTGLIETSDNINFLLPYAVENTGSEGASAQRVREFRQRTLQCNALALQGNSDVTDVKRLCNVEKEIEKDKEIEIDKHAAKRPKKEPDGFEDFWEVYPKKVAKEAARKAFKNVKVSTDILIADVKKRAATKQWSDRQFIPNPATYLNGKRWEDEYQPLMIYPSEPQFAKPDADETDHLKRLLERMGK